MQKIKLHFTDFYDDFKSEDSLIFKLLSKNYDIILDAEYPDYVFYENYGYEHLNYDCVRIFWTGENIRPDFNLCDYAIAFDHMEFGDRYLRFPNFAFYIEQIAKLSNRKELCLEDLGQRVEFCNFIYSNPNANPIRDKFFHLLNERRKIVSAGRHLKNIEGEIGGRWDEDWRASKIALMNKCMFTLAFENSSTRGYTTEKILHAFVAHTVPIYWGNPDVIQDFNPRAFINMHDYDSLEAAADEVMRLEGDPSALLEMLNEPPFIEGRLPDRFDVKTLEAFLCLIFDQPYEQARRRARYTATKNYENSVYRAQTRSRNIDRLLGPIRKIIYAAKGH